MSEVVDTDKVLSKRLRVHYDSHEQIIMELEKTCIISEIKINHLRGKSEIFENQEECADEIVHNLRNRKIVNIMVIAKTQSGKTGTMIALIQNYLNDPRNIIPIENIYIITALSSCEWLAQTKDRMPEKLHRRVYHRDNLTNKFVKDIKNKKNTLVIIDEIQIAAKENQTLYKSFDESGFYNKNKLLNNDVKIVEFTATPDGTIYDLMNWGDHACKIQMPPGIGYTSCFDLLESGRVFQYKDLTCYDRKTGIFDEKLLTKNMNELKTHVDNFSEPMYHIIRTPNGDLSTTVIHNFKEFFGDDIQIICYDKESDVEDINKILTNKPSEHTFIFLKEKLRCAKTLTKTHLGVVYERYTRSRADDAVIIQGLIGRLTGYDDNGKSICFTNIDSICNYEMLWKSKFEDKLIDWHSKTTKRKNKLLHSKGTYNNPSLIDGMSISHEDNEEIEPTIRIFNTFEEAKIYTKEKLGSKRGPTNPKKKINADGFYECNVRRIKKVWSVDEMYKERKCNIKNGAGYGFKYCYRDVTDKETLEFWIIHY
tara:strand:- start:80 stop:1693 length:1614 start_codon:yes stop_codon:yes gene_type:complete